MVIIISKTAKVFIPNETEIIFGKNVKYFRDTINHWSQSDLAAAMGIENKSFISKVENAKTGVSTDYIDRLAKVFNVKPVELFKERDFKF